MPKRKQRSAFCKVQRRKKKVEEVYFVEKILDYNPHKGLYQVQWKGYSDITWEPSCHLHPDLARSYHEREVPHLDEVNDDQQNNNYKQDVSSLCGQAVGLVGQGSAAERDSDASWHPDHGETSGSTSATSGAPCDALPDWLTETTGKAAHNQSVKIQDDGPCMGHPASAERDPLRQKLLGDLPGPSALFTGDDSSTTEEVPPSVSSVDNTAFEAFEPLSSTTRMVRSARTSLLSKQHYDKVNACLFCGRLIKQKIRRHLLLMHCTEPRVQTIQKLTEKEKRRVVHELMCEGNHIYNCKLLSTDVPGEIVVLKRPHRDTPASAFAPCHACHGYVLRADLWRHIKRCPCASDEDATRSNRHLAALCPDVGMETAAGDEDEPPEFFQIVVASMKADEFREMIVKDTLLRQLGASLLINKGKSPNQVAAIRSRLRSMAKLLKTVQNRKELGEKPASCTDLLQPRYFDAVIASVREVCSWELGDEDRPPKYKLPTLALKLGHGLMKLAEKALGMAIKKEDFILQQHLNDYIKLHKSEWGDRVSHAALSTIDLRKMNNVDPLPLTEDVVKLSMETRSQIQDLLAEVNTKSLGMIALKKAYNKLAQLTCAAVIIFNKRRGGEASRLLVETYSTRNRQMVNQDIASYLSPLEQQLAKIMTVVEVIGKRKRRVPVLLTPYMVNALDTLLQLRTSAEVPPNNPYMFAKVSAKSHVKGWDAMKYACNQADLKHPELVTGTKLRKYLATVSQIMNLGDNELEWLANHLGHNLQVHRSFYRLPDEVIQVAKISQLLLASEQGVVHRYANKSLDDIDIGDLVQHLE